LGLPSAGVAVTRKPKLLSGVSGSSGVQSMSSPATLSPNIEMAAADRRNKGCAANRAAAGAAVKTDQNESRHMLAHISQGLFVPHDLPSAPCGPLEATARWQGHAKQLEKPSSPREVVRSKCFSSRRQYGQTVTDGATLPTLVGFTSVVASVTSNRMAFPKRPLIGWYFRSLPVAVPPNTAMGR